MCYAIAPSPGHLVQAALPMYVRILSQSTNGQPSISITSMIQGGTGPNSGGQSGLACWT